MACGGGQGSIPARLAVGRARRVLARASPCPWGVRPGLGRAPSVWLGSGFRPGQAAGGNQRQSGSAPDGLRSSAEEKKQRFETQIYANIPQRRLLPAPRKRLGLRFGRGPGRQRRVRAIRQQSRRRAFRGRFYGAREPLTARRPALCPGRPRRRGRPLPCNTRSLGRAAKRRPPLGLGRQPG